MRTLISIICLFFSVLLNAQNQERSFSKIDAHARTAPYFSDPELLVDYLIKPCKTDWQKTRSIFIWMTNNIAYDTYSYNYGRVTYESCKAMTVYRNRKSVCSGYANLFQMLCGFAELNCMVVNGYAKGAGHYRGKVYTKTNHAWNAIEIDNDIHLFDVTWAAGYYSYGSFHKSFNEFWWDTPPRLFITTHYAENATLNNLDYPVSKSQFEQMAEVKENPKLKVRSKSGKSTFQCKLGLSSMFDDIDSWDQGDYHGNAQIGWIIGNQRRGNSFWGVFPAFGLTDRESAMIEVGTVYRQFLRVSAGVKASNFSWQNIPVNDLSPTGTIGIQIPLGLVFTAFGVNTTMMDSHFRSSYYATIGFSF